MDKCYIQTELISSQCVQQSSGVICKVVAGLALPFACMWTLVIVFAVACYSGLCRSLSWTDCCFGHHNRCSLLALLNFVDHYFGCLFHQFSTQTFSPLYRDWFMVSIVLGWFLHWSCYKLVAWRTGLVPRQKGYHGTSLLCLVFLQALHQPLMAPLPNLIYWQWVSLLFEGKWFRKKYSYHSKWG